MYLCITASLHQGMSPLRNQIGEWEMPQKILPQGKNGTRRSISCYIELVQDFVIKFDISIRPVIGKWFPSVKELSYDEKLINV